MVGVYGGSVLKVSRYHQEEERAPLSLRSRAWNALLRRRTLRSYSIGVSGTGTRSAAEAMERRELETSEIEQTELTQLRDTLEGNFSSINSAQGLKALQELAYEYEQLQPVLDRRRETDPLAVSHIPALAEETYRQGEVDPIVRTAMRLK